MDISEKFLRFFAEKEKEPVCDANLEDERRRFEKLGRLLYEQHTACDIEYFQNGGAVTPYVLRHDCCVLYLHGGGFACGGRDYCVGAAATVAVRCAVKVRWHEYPLAPEHPYPAALESTKNEYLKLCGEYENVFLCGDSSGGGLAYALCLYLRDGGWEQPRGIITFSPWIDLRSPSNETLKYYVNCYTDNAERTYVSPVSGELSGICRSLIFAGEKEKPLEDIRGMHEKLLQSGCESSLVQAEDMWHAYMLYDLRSRRADYELIEKFLDA